MAGPAEAPVSRAGVLRTARRLFAGTVFAPDDAAVDTPRRARERAEPASELVTRLTMPQVRIPAVYMRGGTSRAIIFHRDALPAARADWDAIFLASLGSPDPGRRQLDGLGGGISSLSKIAVVGPPSTGRCGRGLHLRPGGAGQRRSSATRAIAATSPPPSAPSRWMRGWSRPAATRRPSASTTPTPARSSSPASRWRMAPRRCWATSPSTASPAPARRSASASAIPAVPPPEGCCRAARRGRCCGRRLARPSRSRWSMPPTPWCSSTPRRSAWPGRRRRRRWASPACWHGWRRSASPPRSPWAWPARVRRGPGC